MALLLLVPCITIPYGQYLSQRLPNIRVWGWSNLLWLLPALPLAWWQEAAGLPALADNSIPARQRWWWPLVIGSAFGILDILVIKGILHPQPYNELPPFLQPFPYSLFLFTSGALEIEIWYRLLPITMVMLAAESGRPKNTTTTFSWPLPCSLLCESPLNNGRKAAGGSSAMRWSPALP